MLSTIATTINSDKTPETVDTFGRVNSHKCHLILFVPGYSVRARPLIEKRVSMQRDPDPSMVVLASGVDGLEKEGPYCKKAC